MVLKAWAHRTTVGRVVYDRKPHHFNAMDAERVTYKVIERMGDDWEAAKSPKYASKWAWTRMADMSAHALKYYVKFEIPTEKVPGVILKTLLGEEYQPTALHWTAARLIYWIDQIKAVLGPILGLAKSAELQLVWNVGTWFLDLALDGLKKKMGNYTYEVGPPEKLRLF